MKSKQELDEISKLIHACRLISAQYKENSIILCGAHEVSLETEDNLWVINKTFKFPRDLEIKPLALNLLSITFKIIQEKA